MKGRPRAFLLLAGITAGGDLHPALRVGLFFNDAEGAVKGPWRELGRREPNNADSCVSLRKCTEKIGTAVKKSLPFGTDSIRKQGL